MDLVSICKGKLAYFRIKELKDVLNQLCLSKQGKKQDLMDKILGLLSDGDVLSTRGSAKKNLIRKEGVAKIIDDAYRKMQIPEASDLATKGQSGLDVSCMEPTAEGAGSLTSDVRICCPCRSSLLTESMVQCVDPTCQVQQHISCVIIPEKHMEKSPPVPHPFFCEMCRIRRADPFWVTLAHLLSPVKLVDSNIRTDGMNSLQNVEETFELTRADKDLLKNSEYDVQAWCILLNDNVTFRMQWAQYSNLQVNGLSVRTTNRPGSQLLGANGRDNGALITLCIKEGTNKISLSGCDDRIFCFGVRLVKRRAVQQVLSLIPKETDGEFLEDALARVRRCVGGGMATGNEDSDSDLEVIADSITVNLRCPMSGSRMKIAGRFKPCAHMSCFDLETFVELNQQSRKWQCPVCLKNYSLEEIIIDPYFNRITTMMQHCGDDTAEIEVKPDGSWAAKTKGDNSSLRQWHFPDGSLYLATNEVIPKSKNSRQMNKDDSSGHNSLGVRKNINRAVRVGKDQYLSSRYQMEETDQNVITMSIKNDEESSINLDCSQHSEFSTSKVNEINSVVLHNFDRTLGTENQSSVPMLDADVIVLSDSEEENGNLGHAETAYNTCRLNDSGSSLSALPDTYLEDPALTAGMDSCLDLFNGNGNNGSMSTWPYLFGTQAGSKLEVFGSDSDVSGVFIDLENSPVTCSTLMNVYKSASKSTINTDGQVHGFSVNTIIDVDDGFVDNPLAFVSGAPSLQSVLPTNPAGVLVESDLEHRSSNSNGVHAEDWVSLRLGSNGTSVGSDVERHAQSAPTNELDLRNGCGSDEGAFVTDMNNEARSNRENNRKMSGGPFSFPRHPRSVRRRVCLNGVDRNRPCLWMH